MFKRKENFGLLGEMAAMVQSHFYATKNSAGTQTQLFKTRTFYPAKWKWLPRSLAKSTKDTTTADVFFKFAHTTKRQMK
jgi:hypothetical protein